MRKPCAPVLEMECIGWISKLAKRKLPDRYGFTAAHVIMPARSYPPKYLLNARLGLVGTADGR